MHRLVSNLSADDQLYLCILQRFKTLRDMIPNNGVIDSSRLVVQSPLGEGAFG